MFLKKCFVFVTIFVCVLCLDEEASTEEEIDEKREGKQLRDSAEQGGWRGLNTQSWEDSDWTPRDHLPASSETENPPPRRRRIRKRKRRPASASSESDDLPRRRRIRPQTLEDIDDSWTEIDDESPRRPYNRRRVTPVYTPEADEIRKYPVYEKVRDPFTALKEAEEKAQPKWKLETEVEVTTVANLKTLLKQTGSMSLSEVLQKKNLSLDDLLQGKHQAISALTEMPEDATEYPKIAGASSLEDVSMEDSSSGRLEDPTERQTENLVGGKIEVSDEREIGSLNERQNESAAGRKSSVGRQNESSVGKQTGSSIGKQTKNSLGRQTHGSSERQAQDSTGRQAQDSSERETPGSLGRQTPSSSERQAEDSSERQAEDSSERETPDSLGRQTPSSSERQAEDSSERETPDSLERQAEDSHERQIEDSPGRQTPDSSRRQTLNSPERQAPNSPGQQTTDSDERQIKAKRPTHNPFGKTALDLTQRQIQDSSEQSTQDSSEQLTRDSTRRTTQDSSVKLPYGSTERPTQGAIERQNKYPVKVQIFGRQPENSFGVQTENSRRQTGSTDTHIQLSSRNELEISMKNLSGLPNEPQTELPPEHQTRFPFKHQTRLPFKHQAGLPLKHQAGLPLKHQAGLPREKQTGHSRKQSATSDDSTENEDPLENQTEALTKTHPQLPHAQQQKEGSNEQQNQIQRHPNHSTLKEFEVVTEPTTERRIFVPSHPKYYTAFNYKPNMIKIKPTEMIVKSTERTPTTTFKHNLSNKYLDFRSKYVSLKPKIKPTLPITSAKMNELSKLESTTLPSQAFKIDLKDLFGISELAAGPQAASTDQASLETPIKILFPEENLDKSTEDFQEAQNDEGPLKMSFDLDTLASRNPSTENGFKLEIDFQDTSTNELPRPETSTLYQEKLKTTSAREELMELLRDQISLGNLSRILELRNMTIEELVAQRERGSSQLHLADIFHNRTREPEPPNEPYVGHIGAIPPDFFDRKPKTLPRPMHINPLELFKPKPESTSKESYTVTSFPTYKIEMEKIIKQNQPPPFQISLWKSLYPNLYTGQYDDASKEADVLENEVQRIEEIENTISEAVNDRFNIDYEDQENGYSKLPSGVKSAIIASGAIVGISLLVFLTIFIIFRWSQKQKRRLCYSNSFSCSRIKSPILDTTPRRSIRSIMCETLGRKRKYSNVYPQSMSDYMWENDKKPFQ